MSFLDFLDDLPGKLHPAFKDKKSYLREVLHVAGSLILIGIAELLRMFLNPLAPYATGGLLLLWMLYQEFVLHPQKYGQSFTKSILDFLAWCIPFGIYLAVLSSR